MTTNNVNLAQWSHSFTPASPEDLPEKLKAHLLLYGEITSVWRYQARRHFKSVFAGFVVHTSPHEVQDANSDHRWMKARSNTVVAETSQDGKQHHFAIGKKEPMAVLTFRGESISPEQVLYLEYGNPKALSLDKNPKITTYRQANYSFWGIAV